MRTPLPALLLLLLAAACGGGAAPAREEPEPHRTAATPSPEPRATAPEPSRAVTAPERAATAEAPPSAAAPPGRIASEYTTLDPKQCRTIHTDEETGSTTQRCPGVRGYALEVLDGDARMTVSVLAPGGRKHLLRYSSVITSAFSSLGPRAEWRVETTPAGERRVRALIVRVNAFEDPERPERATSYLAVATVSPGRACVTDRIPPIADANARAREAADRAASRPCLPPPG